jgi:hypothetical protein
VTDLNILATSRNMVFRFIFFHPFVADFPLGQFGCYALGVFGSTRFCDAAIKIATIFNHEPPVLTRRTAAR